MNSSGDMAENVKACLTVGFPNKRKFATTIETTIEFLYIGKVRESTGFDFECCLYMKKILATS